MMRFFITDSELAAIEKKGYDAGYAKGYDAGYAKGFKEGTDAGYIQGFEDGKVEGRNNGILGRYPHTTQVIEDGGWCNKEKNKDSVVLSPLTIPDEKAEQVPVSEPPEVSEALKEADLEIDIESVPEAFKV